MKPVVGPFLIAVLLAVAGGGFWMAGQTERRLADLHQQMATLRYVDGMNEDEDADATLGLARRLPRLGDAMANDVRDERALAQYWRSEYTAIEPKRDTGGGLTDTDPHLLLLSANAEFRASQRAGDRTETLRRLDRVVKTYGDVLKTGSCSDRPSTQAAPAAPCDTLM